MFGKINPAPYDLRFSLCGIPIRVHPIFWLSSVWLAWSPGRLDVVLVRVLCIFLAILVHEMGHALMTRRFGWQPEIVLYILGGYATSMRHSTWKDIAVSAAGPGAGFLLYFAFWFFAAPVYLSAQHLAPQLFGPETLGSELLLDAIKFSLFINFVWNAVNLLPILPLDGGQISREYWCWARPRNGMEINLKLSTVAAGSVAAWAAYCMANDRGIFGLDPLFLGLMFGYLCYQSYQNLQSSQRGYR